MGGPDPRLGQVDPGTLRGLATEASRQCDTHGAPVYSLGNPKAAVAAPRPSSADGQQAAWLTASISPSAAGPPALPP